MIAMLAAQSWGRVRVQRAAVPPPRAGDSQPVGVHAPPLQYQPASGLLGAAQECIETKLDANPTERTYHLLVFGGFTNSA